MRQTGQRNLTKALLAVYVIFLTWIILFKMQPDLCFWRAEPYRSVNLIPFGGSAVINGRIDMSEIILNILIFVPYGVYVSMLKDQWGFPKKVAPAFGTSLAFEALQYVFGIGATDITDLLGNTLGGAAGIMLFWLLSKLLKENAVKAVNFIAALGTVIVIGFSLLLVFANM